MTTIDFDRVALTSAVAFASRALPRKAAHLAHTGLRFTSNSGQVTVSAYDYDTYAEARAGACTDTIDLLLPGRALASYLAGMTGARVTLDIGETTADLRSGSARVALSLLPLDNYPSVPPAPASVGSVTAEALAAGFGHVQGCVDPTLGITNLRGVILDTTDGPLTLAGGSPYVFVRRDVDGWDGDGGHAAMLPVTVADVLRTMTGPLALGLDDNLASFSSDDRTIVTRLLAGEPPNWRQVLAARHEPVTTITVDRDELTAALKWVAAGDTRKESFGQVILTATEDGLTVALRGADGLDASTIVDAKIDGEDMTTAWSASYLTQALNATPAGTVTVGLPGPHKAASVTAESDPAFVAVAMPVKLS